MIDQRQSVLVVDHDGQTRREFTQILATSGYVTFDAASVEDAEQQLRGHCCDVVLVDMHLSRESRLALIRRLATMSPTTVALIVTDEDDLELGEMALAFGAYGYLVKPVQGAELLVAVSNALRRRELELQQIMRKSQMEMTVNSRAAHLLAANLDLENAQHDLHRDYEESLHRLANAAEFGVDGTARHVQRVSRYSSLIARGLRLSREFEGNIRLASVLHDVGKIAIPDSILTKPGPLSEDERRIMQQHCEYGHKILSRSSSEVLQVAAEIAWTHHERVDGGGYPRRLHQTEIPLEGRIVAIADVFDALTTDRVYGQALPLDAAIDTMAQARGSQFDDDLLDIFLGAMDDVVSIKQAYSDARLIDDSLGRAAVSSHGTI